MEEIEASLPAMFLEGNRNANKGGLRCLRCGKPVKGGAVLMYRDWRVGEFHDFGKIPDIAHGAPRPYPDGPYEFGKDCAKALRKRANFYLSQHGINVVIDGDDKTNSLTN